MGNTLRAHAAEGGAGDAARQRLAADDDDDEEEEDDDEDEDRGDETQLSIDALEGLFEQIDNLLMEDAPDASGLNAAFDELQSVRTAKLERRTGDESS